MNYTTKEISNITNSTLIGEENLQVKTIHFDSRNIFSSIEAAFIAINSEKNTGEKYIRSAVDKGIKIIISENKLAGFPEVTWIIVENAIRFLQQLAHYHLRQFSLKTIGITGSNGKTVVKEWLYQSVFDQFITVKSPKSFNSQIGLPLSLLQINNKHELGIFEVGISKPSEMEILEEIFSPEIGVLTHIGAAHSSNFISEDQLIEEKIKLFQHSKVIIFNGDHHEVSEKLNQKYADKKHISFGLKISNDVHFENDWATKTEPLVVNFCGELITIPIQQRDEATLSNALCTISLLKELGIGTEIIIEKINNLKSVEMRLESVTGLRDNLIINDSYNLDLDSLKIAYHFINEYNKPQKSLILTDFVEGKNSEKLYHDVAELTNRQKFHQIFLIGTEITQYHDLFNDETITFKNTDELIKSHVLNQIENQLILLKGARKFEIERVKTYLELQKHDTILEIKLNAILHNINVHKSVLKPETKMMAMVKAYSYGLGGYEIAEFLQHHHIDYLGVAYADEGVDLRKNGISTPIMVMNPEQHSYNIIIDYKLEPEIYSFRVLELFTAELKQKGIQKKYPIHIKLETGMHRLGFKSNEVDNLIQLLNTLDVKVASIFSHLATSDIEDEKNYTLGQITEFTAMSDRLIAGLGYQPLRHLLNSSGIVNFSEHQFDMVRIGIGMIGISSNAAIKSKLQNAVTFKSVISQISNISAGDSVGYSRNYKAEVSTRIATLPVGYADGIPRLIGNGVGTVGIRGNLYSIVGNVCMDMMMVDLKNENQIVEGEEVIIFNSQPSLEEFADYCKTIPYEVLTSISRRVKRIYVKN
ncbi:bifunctional UDP-N-acetylmuramoyl-tripeptide:D-alanyl-D-alanine ligase/alanine racemase [Chryseobacterium sp. MP_3.2]|uniref:bifunctional UDP-N-acetylmuramoyl-tripeptide:D-alanyl-D-alanine ligase/alanine racemase n=1 Tax=Chryseobacterium sp. MP_3.2 TaxID=3071712 RepID=UPI002E0311A6|nr:alanine racemase [Chryseobacterium sp. MP_3.2]